MDDFATFFVKGIGTGLLVFWLLLVLCIIGYYIEMKIKKKEQGGK